MMRSCSGGGKQRRLCLPPCSRLRKQQLRQHKLQVHDGYCASWLVFLNSGTVFRNNPILTGMLFGLVASNACL